jgi:hypothetical protein
MARGSEELIRHTRRVSLRPPKPRTVKTVGFTAEGRDALNSHF